LLIHDTYYYYPDNNARYFYTGKYKMTELLSNAQISPAPSYACFSGPNQIAAGSLSNVALAAWQLAQSASTLTFDRKTGKVVDLNLSGSQVDIAARHAQKDQGFAKRGRPKLGVVPREITLLPRHWEWLGQQPGGASVTLRKLVDAARKDSATQNENGERVAAAYQFISAIAGDFPFFEEATRTLFAQDFAKLESLTTNWPADIHNELMMYLQEVLPQSETRPAPSQDEI
jgi:uncharacterized protein